ncbi:MAG: hypothetical protein U0793_30100 [Gemmataceae bacterium]
MRYIATCLFATFLLVGCNSEGKITVKGVVRDKDGPIIAKKTETLSVSAQYKVGGKTKLAPATLKGDSFEAQVPADTDVRFIVELTPYPGAKASRKAVKGFGPSATSPLTYHTTDKAMQEVVLNLPAKVVQPK